MTASVCLRMGSFGPAPARSMTFNTSLGGTRPPGISLAPPSARAPRPRRFAARRSPFRARRALAFAAARTHHPRRASLSPFFVFRSRRPAASTTYIRTERETASGSSGAYAQSGRFSRDGGTRTYGARVRIPAAAYASSASRISARQYSRCRAIRQRSNRLRRVSTPLIGLTEDLPTAWSVAPREPSRIEDAHRTLARSVATVAHGPRRRVFVVVRGGRRVRGAGRRHRARTASPTRGSTPAWPADARVPRRLPPPHDARCSPRREDRGEVVAREPAMIDAFPTRSAGRG